jgi:hypothetical protein
MRDGAAVRLQPGDWGRLEGVVGDRKSPQHHVWRARIVLMTADGAGTMAIRAATGDLAPSLPSFMSRACSSFGLLPILGSPRRASSSPIRTTWTVCR